MECYELSLTPNYVKDWEFLDAVRELIQNGIDQETKYSEKELFFGIRFKITYSEIH
ncbi:MAG: hypothetical protein ACLUUO_05980 [Sellimonas intestinalis]